MSAIVPKKKRVTSVAEMLARRTYVTRLILAGLSYSQVMEAGTRSGQYNEHQITRTYEAILVAWRKEHETGNKSARFEAIQRLRRDLADIRNPGQLRGKNGAPVFEVVLDANGKPVKRNGKPLKKPVMAAIDYARVVAHEAQLAKIEGTLKPLEVKIDVDVVSRSALMAIVSEMSTEKMEALVAEELELARLARIGKSGG